MSERQRTSKRQAGRRTARKPARRTGRKAAAPPRLPGDPSRDALLARILRVDHAGEFGAKRIYDGQLAVLAGRPSEPVIAEMAAAEQAHLARFERLVNERRVRPTLLAPIWDRAGFLLGAGTALLGERAAMACTAAVEEEIDAHYAKQIAALEANGEEPALRETLAQFRRDENEHRETALLHEAERAPGYGLLRGGIRAGTRLAIWLSERL